jgi:hypothetical protein
MIVDVERLRAELAGLKSERKMLLEQYGNRGQKHHMASMIGGLNPAAQRLNIIRHEIARIEKQLRPERPTVTRKLRAGSVRYGLSHDISYRGYRGAAGTDNFGKWYVVAGDEHEIIADNLPTVTKARDAFARWVNHISTPLQR